MGSLLTRHPVINRDRFGDEVGDDGGRDHALVEPKGQTPNVVQCLMMIGQTLKRGEGSGGKDDSQFWEAASREAPEQEQGMDR